MSRLLQAHGDDHPEAARKHLDDASVLSTNGRLDGASYLTGYVVECCLKSLIHHETGVAPRWRGRRGHDLRLLATWVSRCCALAGSRTARYVAPVVLSLSSGSIAVWNPEMRYRAPSMAAADAAQWLADARAVYQGTVAQMLLDGVI